MKDCNKDIGPDAETMITLPSGPTIDQPTKKSKSVKKTAEKLPTVPKESQLAQKTVWVFTVCNVFDTLRVEQMTEY